MKPLIRSDLFRFTGNASTRALVRTYFKEPGFRFQYHLRACGTSRLMRILHRIALNRYSLRYGIQIPARTKIGPGLFIGHFGGIVVHPDAVIGSNVNIAQGVTIGRIVEGKKCGTPIIEDDVWIGPNAVIVGSVRIGKGALIAPLSFVNFDVAPDSVVAGNPATVISDKGSRSYIQNAVAAGAGQ